MTTTLKPEHTVQTLKTIEKNVSELDRMLTTRPNHPTLLARKAALRARAEAITDQPDSGGYVEWRGVLYVV